jgi:hypothetical protein
MPTTTWSTARVDILRPLGVIEAATTTNITTNTSVVSTNLADDYPVDDTFIGWYAMLLNDVDGSTATNNGKVRRVTDYTASTGTITVAGANLTAEDESANFILTRWNPDHVKSWFNRVRQNLFPQIAIMRDHQPLVTGQIQRRFELPTTLRSKPLQVLMGEWPSASSLAENEILNPGFETWGSTTSATSWTLAGSGSTVNQEQQTTGPANYGVFRDDNSARVLNNASDETTLLQTVTPKVATQRMKAHLGVAVYNTSSTSVTARIASTNSAVHGGTGWEILTVDATLGEVTTADVGVAIGTATAFSTFIDEAIFIVGQTQGIVPYWEPLSNYDWIPPVGGGSNNGFIEFPYDLPSHQVLRVLARDMLSSVSADTDTFEVDGELLEPVYDAVRSELCHEAANVGIYSGKEQDFWLGQAGFYRNRSEATITRRRISFPNPRVKVPDMGSRRYTRPIAR